MVVGLKVKRVGRAEASYYRAEYVNVPQVVKDSVQSVKLKVAVGLTLV